MLIDRESSDAAILAELGTRLAALRLAANATQAALAEAAGVSKRTIERLEAGESTQTANLLRVMRALGIIEALDAAIPPVEPGPMALLRGGGRARQRATGDAPDAGPSGPWRWDADP
jgi:transcriptional regulator with XRE-family HTH domain